MFVSPILGKTVSYSNSFLPKSIKIWNHLPCDVSSSVNLNSFKCKLKVHLCCYPQNSYLLRYSVLHDGKLGRVLTNIRIGVSLLRYQLYVNNLSDNPFCGMCCDAVESSEHYFFTCPIFYNVRVEFISKLRELINKIPMDASNYSKLNLELIKLTNWKYCTSSSMPPSVFPNLHKLCTIGVDNFMLAEHSTNEVDDLHIQLYSIVTNYMYKTKRFSG